MKEIALLSPFSLTNLVDGALIVLPEIRRWVAMELQDKWKVRRGRNRRCYQWESHESVCDAPRACLERAH